MMATAPAPLRLIGNSAAMRALNQDIDNAARSRAKVLITGETGVGKEVVARLIHQRSGPSAGRMATINCAGLPDTLLESELFGHVRGSFTDAVRDKPGLLEVADNGTAFLDEAGEMSLRMQAMLLRFLETGELQRVGADVTTRRVNVRIIAATNRDLRKRIEAGEFREDLYYRLNVIVIDVPPLRGRPDDICELFEYFLESYSQHHRAERRLLTDEALGVLTGYGWPGNVRELKNVAERLVVRAPGQPIEVRDLPGEWRQQSRGVPADPGAAGADVAGALTVRMTQQGESFWEAVHAPFINRDLPREHVRAVIRAALERTFGDYRRVAQLFNLPPDDYKRFMAFLRKHQCHFPVHAFRAVARAHAIAPADRARLRTAPVDRAALPGAAPVGADCSAW